MYIYIQHYYSWSPLQILILPDTKVQLRQNILSLYPKYVLKSLSIYFGCLVFVMQLRKCAVTSFFLCLCFQDGSNPDVKNKALSYDQLTYIQVFANLC